MAKGKRASRVRIPTGAKRPKRQPGTRARGAASKPAARSKTVARPKRRAEVVTRRAASARPVRPGPPAYERDRRTLHEAGILASPPSTLQVERRSSAAQTGHAGMAQRLRDHPESGPALTGGDVDANWEDAYRTGDEAPGGDNPTPNQDVVHEIGRSLGIDYADGEELKGAPKIEERDRHRWELDPASSEDYRDRGKKV
jgi:hypothetical protein